MLVDICKVSASLEMNNPPAKIVSLLPPDGLGQYGLTQQFWPYSVNAVPRGLKSGSGTGDPFWPKTEEFADH